MQVFLPCRREEKSKRLSDLPANLSLGLRAFVALQNGAAFICSNQNKKACYNAGSFGSGFG
jgi:hypothetical protein